MKLRLRKRHATVKICWEADCTRHFFPLKLYLVFQNQLKSSFVTQFGLRCCFWLGTCQDYIIRTYAWQQISNDNNVMILIDICCTVTTCQQKCFLSTTLNFPIILDGKFASKTRRYIPHSMHMTSSCRSMNFTNDLFLVIHACSWHLVEKHEFCHSLTSRYSCMHLTSSSRSMNFNIHCLC